MKWDSNLYVQKHGFVAEYGAELLDFVPCDPRQSILDLGCGVGTLTERLAGRGGRVLGVDGSPDMVRQAKKLRPELAFEVRDALALSYCEEWDVIFSNAVFHWIHDHERLLGQLYQALKPGGLLVCEFGAAGNIAVVEDALRQAFARQGVCYTSKFCFPDAKGFSQLAEAGGFIVEAAFEFDRPTPLKDGEKGLYYWARQFYREELEALPEKGQEEVLHGLEELAGERLYNGKEWVVDYRRLRFIARKKTS